MPPFLRGWGSFGHIGILWVLSILRDFFGRDSTESRWIPDSSKTSKKCLDLRRAAFLHWLSLAATLRRSCRIGRDIFLRHLCGLRDVLRQPEVSVWLWDTRKDWPSLLARSSRSCGIGAGLPNSIARDAEGSCQMSLKNVIFSRGALWNNHSWFPWSVGPILQESIGRRRSWRNATVTARNIATLMEIYGISRQPCSDRAAILRRSCGDPAAISSANQGSLPSGSLTITQHLIKLMPLGVALGFAYWLSSYNSRGNNIRPLFHPSFLLDLLPTPGNNFYSAPDNRLLQLQLDCSFFSSSHRLIHKRITVMATVWYPALFSGTGWLLRPECGRRFFISTCDLTFCILHCGALLFRFTSQPFGRQPSNKLNPHPAESAVARPIKMNWCWVFLFTKPANKSTCKHDMDVKTSTASWLPLRTVALNRLVPNWRLVICQPTPLTRAALFLFL